MLLVVPCLTMQAFNSNDKRTFSKGLRNALGHCGKQALDSNNKCTFTGPPENIKGAFVCATKALQLGDWQSLGCSRGAQGVGPHRPEPPG